MDFLWSATLDFERRRYVRRVLREKAFAALKSHDTKVGNIMDISQGGLALEYIGHKDTSRGNALLDIFILGSRLNPYDVSGEVVYNNDIYIPYMDNEFASLLTTRRCGIRFVQLSKTKREQIRSFIELNAYYPVHERIR
jgi:c-di-GMP-binding flagellar brake protein YcgR